MGEDGCARVYMTLLGGGVLERLNPDSGPYQCTAARLVAPVTAPVRCADAAGRHARARPHGTDAGVDGIAQPAGRRARAPALCGRLRRAVHRHRVSAKIRIGPHGHSLRRVKLIVTAGRRTTITMKLSAPQRRLVAAALRHHFHPRIAVHMTVVDHAGNSAARAFNVQISG